MLSLRFALVLFVCYFLAFYGYYRVYFRPRLYLMLLSEQAYLEHYIGHLPHMQDRPEEWQGMAAFLMDKRQRFIRCLRRFVLASTAAYLVLLYLGAAA